MLLLRKKLLFLLAAVSSLSSPAGVPYQILNPDSFRHHVQFFNEMDDENLTNAIANPPSWDWLRQNVPFFECPDREVEEIYYFRWWSFRKHLVSTPKGFVITEFLPPMRHAGEFNTISCAVGHHLMEGRWIRDEHYVDDYVRFWLRGNAGKPQPHLHRFSNWLAAAVWDRYLVSSEKEFVTGILDDLAADYRAWERERRIEGGLFWQHDVEDGMEESISGSRTKKNLRPTINSYMYGNAGAISRIAGLAGKMELSREFAAKAEQLKKLVQDELWSKEDNFVEARGPNGDLSRAREEIGFIPWYFHLPDPGYEVAWKQLDDPNGFDAPYGITTAERRHALFRSHGCCKCEWDGAVWPFASSQTLTALANLLHDYSQSLLSTDDYFAAFMKYVRCQRFDGKPYIGEYLDETTGQWLKGKQERSRYYNHSTFADLVITGLVGLRPAEGDSVKIQPLLPESAWDWFCLDGVRYHGTDLAIIWDRDGSKYKKGKGLSILVGGKILGQRDDLGNLIVKLAPK